jgi:hypothetical protein
VRKSGASVGNSRLGERLEKENTKDLLIRLTVFEFLELCSTLGGGAERRLSIQRSDEEIEPKHDRKCKDDWH